jgi:hypothetical protein
MDTHRQNEFKMKIARFFQTGLPDGPNLAAQFFNPKNSLNPAGKIGRHCFSYSPLPSRL